MAKRVSIKGKPKELDPFTKFLMEFKATCNKKPRNNKENNVLSHNRAQEN